MKAVVAIIALALTVCGDNGLSREQERDRIQQECGRGPLFPGWTVAFDQVNGLDRAIMSRADFNRLAAWSGVVEIYEECVQPQ